MSNIETGWNKKNIEREGAEGENENEVCQLSTTYYQSPGGHSPPPSISLLVQLETKRELTFFLCTSSHVISLSPSPPSSVHTAGLA